MSLLLVNQFLIASCKNTIAVFFVLVIKRVHFRSLGHLWCVIYDIYIYQA
jgi:hypothetical protein